MDYNVDINELVDELETTGKITGKRPATAGYSGMWDRRQSWDCRNGLDFRDGELGDVGLNHTWYVQLNLLTGAEIK